MKIKKLKEVNFSNKINRTVNKVKKTATKANDYALNTTEEVVLETINIATQWQNVTDKALKNSIKILDKKQDLVFTTLENYKKHFLKSKKRFSQIFA